MPRVPKTGERDIPRVPAAGGLIEFCMRRCASVGSSGAAAPCDSTLVAGDR